MTLEDIVPPMELCKQIPTGKFDDSALVWRGKNQTWWDKGLYPRECGHCSEFDSGEIIAPAPTLQEILREMAVGDEIMESHSPELNYNRFCGGWIIRGRTLSISDSIFPDWFDERDKTSPVTAALKLWLDLTKGGKDGK